MRSAVFFLLLLNHIQCRSGHRAKQQASPAPTARRSRTRNLPRWSGIAKYSSTTSSFRYSARPTNAAITWPGTGTTPISRWNFITVSGGRVTGLNISGRYYQGAIPSGIGNLTGLQTLALQTNSLTGGIPTTLGNLTKLQTLTLGSNQLTGRFPQELASLTNLESLTLAGGNNFTGCLPTALRGALATAFTTRATPMPAGVLDLEITSLWRTHEGSESWRENMRTSRAR